MFATVCWDSTVGERPRVAVLDAQSRYINELLHTNTRVGIYIYTRYEWIISVSVIRTK